MDITLLENLEFNDKQTSIKDLKLEDYPQEVIDDFQEFMFSVPYIKNLTEKSRKRAKDLPRDNEGKIIIDFAHPHILENMDYFRQSALHFRKYGNYCSYPVSLNVHSAYYQFWAEEVRRCLYGMIRPEDGEWVTGDYYFYLNYVQMNVVTKDRLGRDIRTSDFPDFWDGQYIISHYIEHARQNKKHCAYLSSRGKGKTLFAASLLAKRFALGESYDKQEKVGCYITASDKKFIMGGDKTLDAFLNNLDFLRANTPFNASFASRDNKGFLWVSGYKDKAGNSHGSKNFISGISSAKDTSKLRGSRGSLYIIEEGGTFANVDEVWQNILPAAEQDGAVTALMLVYGTSGDDDSDFAGLEEMMYHPVASHILALENVYDISGRAGKVFSCFFPAYLNVTGRYDSSGNSDVTSSLLYYCNERYLIKHNTSKLNLITKFIAERPITPQEAVLKTKGSKFPLNAIITRIAELDDNPHLLDDISVGDLVYNKEGELRYAPTPDQPIRDYPVQDNKIIGAIEFYAMPVKDESGNVPWGRYIAAADPVDQDEAPNTTSLFSIFVLDLYTDNIVCEWTGRFPLADLNFERAYKICMFYNAQVLYENNIKGMYSYFAQKKSIYMLADTPPYLKDKELIKNVGIGNTTKGVRAIPAVNNEGDTKTVNWLLTEHNIVNSDGEEVKISKLNTICNRAFLRECLYAGSGSNVDRIRAFGLLMIFREQKMVDYGGNFTNTSTKNSGTSFLSSSYFTNNYENNF